MTADSNPYSPPASETLEVEEKDFPWYVAAKGIYVREGAVLPPVDLKSGATGTELLPLSYQVRSSGDRYRPVYPIVIIIAVAVLSALQIPLPWRIAAIAVTTMIVSLLIKKGIRKIQFTHFGENRDASLRNKMRTWQIIEIVSISGAVISLACVRFNEWAMLSLLLLVCLSRFARNRQSRHRKATLEIRAAGGAPGWVRIGGAHPEALAALRLFQFQRREAEVLSKSDGPSEGDLLK